MITVTRGGRRCVMGDAVWNDRGPDRERSVCAGHGVCGAVARMPYRKILQSELKKNEIEPEEFYQK